ncbi:anti-CBASS protein Acb1 family protein [Xanthomonas sp. NCPPB 1068]|uniref:anti-CBASS protein Acb1 family protein n=1 Tax=Xanthomonas sp. NCPPB 1068 TaxID=487525 RepID=UPI0035590171
MGKLAQFKDGLVNLVANLGTARDKAVHSHYALAPLSDLDASNAYRGTWLARKIIDIPALDGCRNWRTWNADQSQISAIEAEEKRLGLQVKLLQAHTKARLFGGAAIYIGTGDSDVSKPLDPTRVRKEGVKHLNVLTKRILSAGELDRDAESPSFGQPAFYTLTSARAGQVQIHPSRLVILHGAHRPDPDIDNGDGWGDSVLMAVSDSVKRADNTSANIDSLVFEAKVDVLNIPNLMSQLADPAYEAQLLQRLQLAAMAKGINGMLVLDGEETYTQKSASFSGLVDVMLAFLQQVSGAADIPLTRLLGQSPGGLNSTGDNDIRNYYDRIKASQELIYTPAMSVLDECLIYSALGSRPKDVFYSWRSLWQTSDTERATNGKTTADTIKTLADTKLIPDEVLAEVAVNMLTEAGVAPGLESAMDDFSRENPDWQEEQAEEERAAAQLAATARSEGNALNDAELRSLYVRRDVLNAAEIGAWAREQGITDIADDLHVTVAYSRQAFDWIKAGNASEWSNDGNAELIIPPGGPRATEPLGGMSAVILFASTQLAWRHEEIVRAGASHDFPDYTPHISLTKAPIDLSKVEPYRGRIVLGPEIFEEIRED